MSTIKLNLLTTVIIDNETEIIIHTKLINLQIPYCTLGTATASFINDLYHIYSNTSTRSIIMSFLCFSLTRISDVINNKIFFLPVTVMEDGR